jgi:MATE family multidrug resistance protein
MSSSQPRQIPSYETNLNVDPESEAGESGEPLSHHSTRGSKHGFSRSFRSGGNMLPNVPTMFAEPSDPELLQNSERERERLMKEQRSLLRDNEIIPGKRSASVASGIHRWRSNSASDVEHGAPNTETTPLVGNENPGPSAEEVYELWEDAIMAGNVKTTWRRETKVLTRYSVPLIVTYLLQYSLTVASVFTIGHIGKIELGAVSLASSMFAFNFS